MELRSLTLKAYGRCTDVTVDVGDHVTVVVGANEAGKSTALDALSDLLWGIPLRTSRASEYQRSQLRIDATLDINGEVRELVRKSTGLFATDLVTAVIPPWIRDDIDAQWWRTRLGIDHDELRRGGAEVFAGHGDIAEVVFAAREGRSARAVLADIEAATDELFKTHKGNKSVKLRLAEAAYNRAVADRDSVLTRAGDVVHQREVVATAQRELERATAAVAETSQALKQADEDARVITSVLSLRRARAELAAIDAEGSRLSPAELVEHLNASASRTQGHEAMVRLTGEIDNLNRLIRELDVDDSILDDKATLDRLQPHAAARIADLQRAEDEFGPAVTEATSRLRSLLADIGVETGDDLATALASVRIRTDHAADLDALADRIEKLELKRDSAKEKRNEALNALLAKGVAVDAGASTPPSEDAIDALRDALVTARAHVVTLGTLLDDARAATGRLRDGAPSAHADPAVSHDDVVELRTQRDTYWSEVRRSWVSGDLPEAGARVDMAADFDGRILAADRMSDDESTDRARVAAEDARIEAHVEGLEAALLKEEGAAKALAHARDEVDQLEAQWRTTWSSLGIETAPNVDTAPTVVDLLVTARAAHAKDLSAAGQIADLDDPWAAALALVGLPPTSTTAAWRTQAHVLEQVASVQEGRADAQGREAKARKEWGTFLAEALVLLERHGAYTSGQEITPAQVELGLSQLLRLHTDATAASATRAGYREQIDGKSNGLDDARLTEQLASAVLARLAQDQVVAVGADLDALAERAARASDPLARESAAFSLLNAGVDPGSSPTDVISRLQDESDISVHQARDAAKRLDDEAQAAENTVRDKRTTAFDALTALESTAGAADAEVEVMARQSEVVRLTEEWAVLSLQRQLLANILAGFGNDDARPLLDRAGQILDRLTDGRWVALRAEEDVMARRLRVLRADNDANGMGELSEGTADQVFFALRLAAVAELHAERLAAGEQALPLVLDDVLMAFDDERTADALEILRDLAPGLQVIVFTHHARVGEAAAALEGVMVSHLPAPAPIIGALDGGQVRAHAQAGAVALDHGHEQQPPADVVPPAAVVRQWAREQGLEVTARGRVSPELIVKYLQANP